MKQALKCDFTWADFKTNSDGMVPVVVQDAENDEVLMLAYMNEELRQRYNPCQSRTGRRSVPHRKPHLLLPDPGRIKIFDSEHKKSSCFTE